MDNLPPTRMNFPGWGLIPPRARRYYLVSFVLVALSWVSVVCLVLLPPSSAFVALPLLFLPVGVIGAVLLTWRGVSITRRWMVEQHGRRD